MNITKPMCRVVLTCWEPKSNDAYSDFFIDLFETKEDALSAIKAAVKDELEILNDREYAPDEDVEYPADFDSFRADFDSDEFDAIIRLWDGDDYWPVTGYNIYWVSPAKGNQYLYRMLLDEEDGIEYIRSFFIAPCTSRGGFCVMLDDEYVYFAKDFSDALSFVDHFLLEIELVKAHPTTQKYQLTLNEGEEDEEKVSAYLSNKDRLAIQDDMEGKLQCEHLVLLTNGAFIDTGVIDACVLCATCSDEEKEWAIPVMWTVCGTVKVKAKTLEDAVDAFQENIDHIRLPDNADYVEGSFELAADDLEYIKAYNQSTN